MNLKTSKRVSPKWSLATSFWFCVGVTVLVAPFVFLTAQKSIWVELEIATGILAGFMFIYFSVILHQGVRFNDARQAIIDWPAFSPSGVMEGMGYFSGGDFFGELGRELGIVGWIVGFLLDLVVVFAVALLLCGLIWLGMNGVGVVVLFLYWVHRRWLRYLVTRGRRCRGNWLRSLYHGGKVALFYSFWFYAAILVAQQICKMTGQ